MTKLIEYCKNCKRYTFHDVDTDECLECRGEALATFLIAFEGIAPDAPEVNENSPYEYLPGNLSSDPKWYVLWHCGFAGPFNSEDEANQYKKYGNLDKHVTCYVEKLSQCYLPSALLK